MDEETGSDKLKADRIHLKTLESRYRDFCEKTGLPTRTERLQTASFGRSQASKAVWEYKKVATSSQKVYNELNVKDIVGEVQFPDDKKLLEKISLIPESHRRLASKYISKVEISHDSPDSGYDPVTRVITVSATISDENSIIHEYGHALDRAVKANKDPKFIAIRSAGLEHLSINDIIEDETSFTELIYRVEHPKFISDYQGRMYPGFYSGSEIALDTMYEYFSEGYREYIVNPDNLKAHDPELYDYFEEIGK